tara:strand:- start:5786 stop:6379 length:594 start_codon:yes stop_codon:yes gene_type:complete
MADNDFLSMIEEDSSTGSKLNLLDAELHTVAEFVNELASLDTKIELLDEELKTTKAIRHKVATEKLPALLMELGLTEMKMDDGSQLTMQQVVKGSIKVGDRPAAHDWLRENGHGDLVKHIVSVSFGAGEDEVAEATKALLSSHLAENTDGLQVEDKETVHNQTLNAWLKKQVESGEEEIPAFFNLFITQEAKLKGVK